MSAPLRAAVLRVPRHSIRWALELLWRLTLHRVSVRYKETIFGAGWIVLQPVALTVIFTYIFQRFAQVSSGTVPYPLFTATGLVAWSFTALAVGASAISLVGNRPLLTRVALPRMLLPLSAVAAALVDLGVMLMLLVGLGLYYRMAWPPTASWALLLLALHLVLLVGLGCLIALTNVLLRDVGHAIPSLLQLWFFASPVFYPVSMVPREFRVLAQWNPMTGLIEGYRAVLLAGRPPPWELVGPAAVATMLLLVLAVLGFRRLEGTMVDLL